MVAVGFQAGRRRLALAFPDGHMPEIALRAGSFWVMQVFRLKARSFWHFEVAGGLRRQ
jgi:hypothetical protein